MHRFSRLRVGVSHATRAPSFAPVAPGTHRERRRRRQVLKREATSSCHRTARCSSGRPGGRSTSGIFCRTALRALNAVGNERDRP
eukprot:4042377-Prymnesium_polylepis.1